MKSCGAPSTSARAGRHRQGQQAHQPHVVVERQPRHEHVIVGIEAGRLGHGIEVGAQHAVGEHDALGVGRGPAGELQDRQPVGVIGRANPRAPGSPAARSSTADHRRVAGLGHHEGGQLWIDDHQAGVGVTDAPAGLGDELLDRGQPHRQWQHHDGGARQPGALDGGDQRPGGGREEGDMVARADPPRLEGRGVGLGLLVELTPGHGILGATDDEGDARTARSPRARRVAASKALPVRLPDARGGYTPESAMRAAGFSLRTFGTVADTLRVHVRAVAVVRPAPAPVHGHARGTHRDQLAGPLGARGNVLRPQPRR